VGQNVYHMDVHRIFYICLIVSVSRDFQLVRNVYCQESTVSPVHNNFRIDAQRLISIFI